MTEEPCVSSVQEDLRERLHAAIPGGAHTYAKGDDQWPANAPALLVRGQGCRVWDAEGNEFVEYGIGLRAVGDALAVYRRALDDGVERYLVGPSVKPVYRRFN